MVSGKSGRCDNLRREVKSLKSVVRAERKGLLMGGGLFGPEGKDAVDLALLYSEFWDSLRIWEYELGGERESNVSGKNRSELSSPTVEAAVFDWLERGLLKVVGIKGA